MPPTTTTRLGATPLAAGGTAFAVWAPAASSVAVRLERDHPLAPAGDGIWAGEAPAAAQPSPYVFSIDRAASPDFDAASALEDQERKGVRVAHQRRLVSSGPVQNAAISPQA